MTHLQPHAEAMARYLWSRKRPVEETDMRILAKKYAEEMGVAGLLHTRGSSKIVTIFSIRSCKRHRFYSTPLPLVMRNRM